MKRLLKVLGHLLLIALLTVVTQIGGIPYLAALLICKRKTKTSSITHIGIFALLYLFCTFLIVPVTAPILGREKIKESKTVEARSFFYILANRNYVKPELNNVITSVSKKLDNKHPGIKLQYLDANFPFFDKFPLLPHLSHNDGKKIDISLIYENSQQQLSNKKKSVSGYGVYEGPKSNEYDQITVCKERGNWQYDFPKYLTLGTINKDLQFSKEGTADLINGILTERNVGKVFIEPHLKNRLGLTNRKVRFHGCQAVRHDDHIHFQLK